MLLCYACSGGPQADTTDETGAPPAATLDAVLDIDEAWFWEGETLNGQVPSLSLCDTYLACPSYLLDVAPGGKRLRIGLDTPERTDSFGIHVFAPDGSLAGEDDNFNQFNSEVLIDEPTAGLWRVQIRPDNATYASFRMRAKLESALTVSPALPADPKPLLPNLRTVPPTNSGSSRPPIHSTDCTRLTPSIRRCRWLASSPSPVVLGILAIHDVLYTLWASYTPLFLLSWTCLPAGVTHGSDGVTILRPFCVQGGEEASF